MRIKGSIPTIGTGVRGTWIWDSEKMEMVPEEKFEKKKEVHNVIQDTFKVPVSSMATYDGKVFDSKSAYRRHLKENGYRETGGDHLKDVMLKEMEAMKESQREERMKEIMDDAEKVLMDLKYDRVPVSEEDKAKYKKEAEKWGKSYWITR